MISRLRSLAIICLFLPATSSALAQGPWVRDGSDGRLLYRHDPLGNRILDFSGTGYRGGHEAIPNVPVVHTIPAGTGSDDTARVQAAIDLVSALPLGRDGFRGALLLGPGEFKIAGSLVVAANGVVLRGSGEGAGGTVLKATGVQAENSRMIYFTGAGNRSGVGTTRNIVDVYVPVGARSFTVDNVTDFKVGQEIFIRHPSPQAWIEEVHMHLLQSPWQPGARNQDFERRIIHIEGRRIFIDEPLPWAIESRFGGATIRGLGWSSTGRIDRVGIEDIRGVSEFASATDEAHSWNFVVFNRVTNGWARRLTSEHFAYSCVNLSSQSKWITVANCSALTPKSQIAGGRRYAFPVAQSEFVLVRDCFMTQDRHGFVTHSNTAGPIAFVDGLSLDTKSDHGPHHRWATGLLYDNINVQGNRINIQNRGNSGTGHGWAGANSVVWNSVASSGYTIQRPPGAKNWAIGNVGSIVTGTMFVGPTPALGDFESHGTQVFPQSLYWAQWQDRARSGAPAEIRDYWLGNIDAFASGGAADAAAAPRPSWLSAVIAADGSLITAGFDTVGPGLRIPFTFQFALAPGKKVAAARLVLAVKGASGSSAATATARIGSASNAKTFTELGWALSASDTTTATLDLADQLQLVQTGAFDVSIEKGAGVDWAMLELQISEDILPESTIALTPAADANTRGGTSSNLNFGSATTIQVKEDSSENTRRNGHLRWQIPATPGQIVTRARVRLSLTAASTSDMENVAGLVIHPTWSESELTWNNQPARVHRLGSWRCSPGTVEFTVTPFIQEILSQGGSFGIVIQGARSNAGVASYASKENTNIALRPQLILELTPADATALAENFEDTALGARPNTFNYGGLGTNASAEVVSFRGGKGLKIRDNSSTSRVRVEANFVAAPAEESKLFRFSFAARRNSADFSTAADSNTALFVSAGSHSADLSANGQRAIEIRIRQDGRLIVNEGTTTHVSAAAWPGIDNGVDFDILVNATDSPADFRGPDGAAHVLAAGKWSIWADRISVQMAGKTQFAFRAAATGWTSGSFGKIGFITGNAGSNVGMSHTIDDVHLDLRLAAFPRLGFGLNFETDPLGGPPSGFTATTVNTASSYATVVGTRVSSIDPEDDPPENTRALKLYDNSTTGHAAVEANFVGSVEAQRDFVEFSFHATRNLDFDPPASSSEVALFAALGSYSTSSEILLNSSGNRPVELRLRQDGRLVIRDGDTLRTSTVAIAGLDQGLPFSLIANSSPNPYFYQAPDGRPATAEPGRWSLWVGTQPIELDGLSQFAFSTPAASFGRLGFHTGQSLATTGISFTLDEITAGRADQLSEPPPPLSVAWDTDSSLPGAQGGSGTWSTSIPNWWDNGNIPWPAGDFNAATFGAVGGTVTVRSPIRAGSLHFTTSGYTLVGDTLTLTGPSPEISSTDTVTINTDLAGTNGLSKTGPGTLVLSRPGYSGNTSIEGTLDVGPNHPSGNLQLRNSGTLQAAGTLARTLSASSPTGFHVQPGTTASFAARGGDFTIDLAAPLVLGPESLFGQNLSFGSPTADSKILLQNPLDFNAATRTVTVTHGSVAELAGTVSNGGLSKLGDGTLVLSANNTFGQGTFTLGPSSSSIVGALRLAAPSALGGHTLVSLNAGGSGVSRLELSGGHSFAPANINTRGRPNAPSIGAALVNIAGNNTWNGDITITGTGGSYVIRSEAATLVIKGGLRNNIPENRNWDIHGDGDTHIQGVIGENANAGSLGLRKFGSGTLSLSGANVYRGATSVSGGTLRIDGDQSAATGPFTIGSGATLAGNGISGAAVTLAEGANLAANLRDWTASKGSDRLQVASLTTNGLAPIIVIETAQLVNFAENAASFTFLTVPGGIDAFDPSLTTLEVSGFPGTGTWSLARNATELTLNYQPEATDPYLAWIGTHHLTGSSAAPDADPDADSIANLIEFVIGGNPVGGPDQAKLPVAIIDGNDFVVTYRRAAISAYLASGIEYSSTLAPGWTRAEHGVNGVTITVTPDGFGEGIDRIEVRLPTTLAPAGKLFARLTVTSS